MFRFLFRKKVITVYFLDYLRFYYFYLPGYLFSHSSTTQKKRGEKEEEEERNYVFYHHIHEYDFGEDN